MTAESFLFATLAGPLALLVACLNRQVRRSGRLLLPLAPLPALATAVLAPDGARLTLPDAFLGLTFVLDRPGALLLGTAALLWIAAGVYAGAWRQPNATGERFTIWWLATLTGSLGVFIAADLPGFYLFFTIVSLSAYWLVVDDGTPSAARAGAVYVSLALLAEAFLLLAFILLAAYSPGHSLLILDTVSAIGASPMRDIVLALIVLGFGLKIGLVPLHVWMPLTYTAAPIPVAAVLSGAAVKAGVIGLIRFLPFDTPSPGWGEAITALGLVSAFYGVVIGLTQRNPRTVLAYSSVSQMGVIATVLGMGLTTGNTTVPLLVAFYALHHILVKGGLFLAIGITSRSGLHGAWPVLLPATVIALGFGGLPFTGGALAKLAVKAPLGDGMIGMLAMLSAAGSTLLMLHFLRRLWLACKNTEGVKSGTALVLPWLAIAFAAIALPWALYPYVMNATAWSELFTAKVLWETLWPVLVGGFLALVLYRWENRLPRIPAGDVLAADRALVSFARKLGAGMERMDWNLRRWPIAGVIFLLLTIILAGTMFGQARF